MYIALRLFAVFFALILCIFLFKVRKKAVLFLVLAAVLALSSLPFENLFLSFDKPEKLFNYYKNGQIVGIVQGEESCMVYYLEKQNVYSRVIFRKKDGLYKFTLKSEISTVYHSFDEKGSFKVYNVKGTDDYYLFAACFSDDVIIKAEGKNDMYTDFRQVEETCMFYGYINRFDESCYISIE